LNTKENNGLDNAVKIGHLICISVVVLAAIIGPYILLTQVSSAMESHIELPAHKNSLKRIETMEKDMAAVRTDIRWIREYLKRSKNSD